VKNKKAFTLIELLVVIAIIALLIGILLPAIGKARDSARNVLSQNRMRQLNVGANSYAADNGDRIFSFSWTGYKPNPNGKGFVKTPYNVGCDETVLVATDLDASSAQIVEILRRVTGRCDDFDPTWTGRLWQRRWSHVTLLDYLSDTQPEQIASSPFDKNQLDWAADPLNYGPGSTVPYANGSPGAGYDSDGNWPNEQVRNKWAFASSYQTVPVAWNTDGIGTATYIPVADTPHLFQAYDPNRSGGQGIVRLGQRKYAQVAFPGGKVLQFEEFDRLSDRNGKYFAYPDAQCNLSFFDGSVRRLVTADANPGWNPRFPDQEWRQVYIPLDTFPEPEEGLGNGSPLCTRFRWTRFGLQGIDYGGEDVGRRQYPGLEPDTSAVDCGP